MNATTTPTDASARRAAHLAQGSGLVSPPLLVLTLVLAAVVTATSLAGLLAPWAYAAETANWRLQGQGQDVGNLAAVAVLLAGLALARRGSAAGLQVWLGSLLYLAYAFLIYAVGVHFGPLFLPYVAALGLSVYGLLFGVAGASGQGVRAARTGHAGGWVLTGIAVLFALLWLGSIVPANLSGRTPAELLETGLASNPVHVLDLALVLPGMAVTAALARRGRPVAELLVAPWLVFSALMGASIVVAILLTGAAAVPLVALCAVTLTSAWFALSGLRQRPRP